jgi:DNA polymerase III delta prime subunit
LKISLPQHHAILVESDQETALALFRTHLENGGREIERNPDVMFVDFQSFGIDEARSLIALSLNAPVRDEKKTVVLSIGDITREAQNALLKLFEDPNPHVEFLITIDNAHALLPTLRSRLHIVTAVSASEDAVVDPKEFINSSLGERMALIEKIVKDQKDSGSKSGIRAFLRALVSELEKEPTKNADALKATAQALLYIDDKGASVKLLLESAALAL